MCLFVALYTESTIAIGCFNTLVFCEIILYYHGSNKKAWVRACMPENEAKYLSKRHHVYMECKVLWQCETSSADFYGEMR